MSGEASVSATEVRTRAPLPSGVVTFVFTDIEASTRILEEHRAVAGRALARHHELVANAITDAGGAVFETVGDAVYGAFTKPDAAIGAAVAVQRTMAAEDWGDVGDLRVRISVHTGAVETRDDHYFGAALFECARLQSLAHGGQTLASATTAALTATGLPDDITLTPLGRHRLKDLASPMEVVQVDGSGLRRDFPPLRASTTIPNNLPRETTSLVGRQEDLDRVDALLDVNRLVTLLGPGGTGKTRLATELGRRRLYRHPDGVFLVDLSPITDPALVAGLIAEGVGVRARPGETDEPALTAYLAERDILLILDNWEQVLAGAPLIGRVLGASDRLVVLATSRVPLRIRGEARYRLPPLAVGGGDAADTMTQLDAPAVRLFVERAMAADPWFALDDTNTADVLALCRMLDGLPLAIELAAARIDLLTPAAMVRGLAGGESVLEGGTDLPKRQRTLEDTVAWSADLLAEPERELLATLGVFPGSFPIGAVESITRTDPIVAQQRLATLTDASLLVRREDPLGEPRFAMLETVRSFAIDELDRSGRVDEVRTRHALWVADLAEDGERGILGRDANSWVRAVDLQHGCIHSALAWSIGKPLPEAAARIVGAMWRFWDMHGSAHGEVEWCQRVLAFDLEERWKARVLNTIVVLELRGGRAERAVDAARSAVAIYETTGPLRELADAVNNLANVSFTLGDIAAAEAQWIRSAELWRDAGDPRGESAPVFNLADVAIANGNSEQALAYAEQSLSLARESDSPLEVGFSLCRIAEVKLRTGRRDGVAELLDAALRALHDGDDLGGLVVAIEWVAALWLSEVPPRPLQAARLQGATDRHRAQLGHPLVMGEQEIRSAMEPELLASLGEAGLEQARLDGATLDMDALVRYALGEFDPFTLDEGAGGRVR